MPTYEYRCANGHRFERIAKMSESAAELPCPECGATAARQISGGAGLVFKGSGFYLTDYGRNAHRGSEPAAASAKKGEGSHGESNGSESKSTDSSASEAKPAESKPASATSGDSKSSGSAPATGTSGTSSTSSGSSAPKSDK